MMKICRPRSARKASVDGKRPRPMRRAEARVKVAAGTLGACAGIERPDAASKVDSAAMDADETLWSCTITKIRPSTPATPSLRRGRDWQKTCRTTSGMRSSLIRANCANPAKPSKAPAAAVAAIQRVIDLSGGIANPKAAAVATLAAAAARVAGVTLAAAVQVAGAVRIAEDVQVVVAAPIAAVGQAPAAIRVGPRMNVRRQAIAHAAKAAQAAIAPGEVERTHAARGEAVAAAIAQRPHGVAAMTTCMPTDGDRLPRSTKAALRPAQSLPRNTGEANPWPGPKAPAAASAADKHTLLSTLVRTAITW